jgi:DNA-binding PadR family transcriptional regulator
MFLARYKWYRRWRGGKWARTAGFFWPHWIRVPDECVERVDEYWFTWSRNPLRRQEQMQRRILLTIDELGPGRTTLTIHQRLEVRGMVDRAHFYLALGHLVDKGLVVGEKRRGGPERRYEHQEWWAYSLTDQGRVEIGEDQFRLPCSICAGCLPPGEQCRACGRINQQDSAA